MLEEMKSKTNQNISFLQKQTETIQPDRLRDHPELSDEGDPQQRELEVQRCVAPGSRVPDHLQSKAQVGGDEKPG